MTIIFASFSSSKHLDIFFLGVIIIKCLEFDIYVSISTEFKVTFSCSKNMKESGGNGDKKVIFVPHLEYSYFFNLRQ